MRLTDLEVAILNFMLTSTIPRLPRNPVQGGSVKVESRDFSADGFLTIVEPTAEVEFFGEGVSMVWSEAGAKLNDSVHIGCLVFIDCGYVTGIEGYTYGDQIPDNIEIFSLYNMSRGTELP